MGLISAGEAARRIGISKNTFRHLVEQDNPPFRGAKPYPGATIKYKEEDVERYLDHFGEEDARHEL